MAAPSAESGGVSPAPVSIVVPALDEGDGIVAFLAHLQPLRAAGCEVLLVDGGSGDDTVARATGLCDAVVVAECGRAAQMNAGAQLARGEVLLFLHADTRLPEGALGALCSLRLDTTCGWGRFDVELDGADPLLRVVAWAMNLRSRLTGIATGDQAMFVRADVFHSAGGFPAQPLMEDIELSSRLCVRCRPVCLRLRVRTSGRRWMRHGVLRTIVLMWRLRLAYFLGVAPDRLQQIWSRS